MNLKEGTRRLALLLGVLGAVVGGIASYAELQTTLAQRTRHANFQKLVTSDRIQQLCKDHQGIKEPWEKYEKSVMPSCCGIREVVWDTDHIFNDSTGIYSIETDGGQNLRPTPAPATWEYPLIALFPLLGFFIPWGTVRAIGWVGAGFVQPAK